MKKTIVAAILGIAVGAAVQSAHAQGSIYFANYQLNGSLIVPTAVVTLGSLSSGNYVGSDYTAELFYQYGANLNTANWTLAAGSQVAFNGTTGSGSPTTDGAGLFAGNTVSIPGYSSGAVNLEVTVSNGTSTGTSAVVSLSSLATGLALPGDMFSDNPAVTTPFTAFFVPVPEPTTLALAGFGGLASLIALRRKQA